MKFLAFFSLTMFLINACQKTHSDADKIGPGKTTSESLIGTWQLVGSWGGMMVDNGNRPPLKDSRFIFTDEHFEEYESSVLIDSGAYSTIIDTAIHLDDGTPYTKLCTTNNTCRSYYIRNDTFALDYDAPAYDGICYYYIRTSEKSTNP